MRNLHKITNIALIFTLIGVFLCQELYALRVPMNGHKKMEKALKETLVNLPTDQLIREAKMSMPRSDEKEPDYTVFNEKVKELKKIKSLDVMVLSAREFKYHKEVNVDYETYKWLNSKYLELWGKKDKFLFHTIQNINQHVKPGIVLVIQQERTTRGGVKYTDISVIDNGRGPIDKHNNAQVPIEEIVKYGVSKGAGGRYGVGLTHAVMEAADLSIILTHGNTKLIKGGMSVFRVALFRPAPKILWQSENEEPHGMTVVGIFCENKDRKDVEQDVIKRLEELENIDTSIMVRTEEPITKQWKSLDPLFPLGDLPGFKHFIFPLGTTFGSKWNWGENEPYHKGYSLVKYPPRFHYGADFFRYRTRKNKANYMRPHAPVKAMLSGKVIIGKECRKKVIGHVVAIETPVGLVVYSHVIPLVGEGTEIKKGDVVATIQNLKEGTHFHLEVINGSFNFPSREDFKYTGNWVYYDDDAYYEAIVAYLSEIEPQYSFDPLLLWPEIAMDAEIAEDTTIHEESIDRSIRNTKLLKQSI